MGQKSSIQQQTGILRQPQEVCAELNSSSSSQYSNYEALRTEEDGCYNKYQETVPSWLTFYRRRCMKLSQCQLSWALKGEVFIAVEGKKQFSTEYDNLFQRKLKETKQIHSGRQSIIAKEPDMNNLLKDLDETSQHFQEQNPQEENPNQNQQFGAAYGANTSFPSYMVDNQFQGLRAGNITMLNFQDIEGYRKNLMIYLECTQLISEHLENPNFTMNIIRETFISCFYNRYSKQVKAFKLEQYNEKLKQEQEKEKQSEHNSQSIENGGNGQRPNSEIQQKAPTQTHEIINKQGTNGSTCKLGIDIATMRLSSDEKFIPSPEAIKIYQNALSEFQYFITIFMETVKQYYDIHYKKKENISIFLKELFSYRNFQNFIISRLFCKEETPKLLLDIIKIVTPDDSNLINSIPQNVSPSIFEIPPAFSLNQDTIKYLGITNAIQEEYEEKNIEEIKKISNQKQEKEQDQQKEEQFHQDDQDFLFEMKIHSNSSEVSKQFRQFNQRSESAFSMSVDYQQSDSIVNDIPSENPYEQCIQCIRNLQKNTSPTGKFKQIILACEGIENCIRQFYIKQGMSQKQALDEDSIISILTYIIAQAKVPSLEAHCKFVQAFYKSPTKKLKLRYYLLAFEASVRNVHELFSQQVNKESINDMKSDTDDDERVNASLNCTARSIFQKNVTKKLNETFGNNQSSRNIANITGKNSIFKQALAEMKPMEIAK